MNGFYSEGSLLGSEGNTTAVGSREGLYRACENGTILEARAVLCDREHNLHLRLGGGIHGIIPRVECALGIDDGSVRDIAIISRVNKPVCFTVTGFFTENGKEFAKLSRVAAQKRCLSQYVNTLVPGDVIPVRAVHFESFGAFCDIGCGISALLPIDAISVSRIPHPSVRLNINGEFRAVVSSTENGRITLTLKELLGTWEENAGSFSPGETVPGIIRSVESYGIFVELSPNLAGLAEYAPDVKAGQAATVYIKNIIPEKMKIKLVIVDSFDQIESPAPLKYFTDAEHIDRFCYSPPYSERQIETIF
ncbi:MAG: 30S ribosomal protein S1 [Clostridiales bacterium]|nr:30S ribosomal protein S1 [Clostridiales bacterium]